tara:strand:+ start:167 stop:685 length:519 start_codon:yes stop_codon:yes gene_type:complete
MIDKLSVHIIQSVLLSTGVTFSLLSILKLAQISTQMKLNAIIRYNFLGMPILLISLLSIFITFFSMNYFKATSSTTQSLTATPTTSEIDSKPITEMEARKMVLDERYNIDDFFIDIKNGEWVRFVYLTNDGRDSQILSISANSPKNSAIIEILHRGNPVKINSRWSFLKPLK